MSYVNKKKKSCWTKTEAQHSEMSWREKKKKTKTLIWPNLQCMKWTIESKWESSWGCKGEHRYITLLRKTSTKISSFDTTQRQNPNRQKLAKESQWTTELSPGCILHKRWPRNKNIKCHLLLSFFSNVNLSTILWFSWFW